MNKEEVKKLIPAIKVKYKFPPMEHHSFGRCDDPRDLLSEGEVYQVESKDVSSWYTLVKLVGISGHYNSVIFDWNDTPEKERLPPRNGKQVAVLQNWSYWGSDYLSGVVYHHPYDELSDGSIVYTSTLLFVNEEDNIAETKNTIYLLGDKA